MIQTEILLNSVNKDPNGSHNIFSNKISSKFANNEKKKKVKTEERKTTKAPLSIIPVTILIKFTKVGPHGSSVSFSIILFSKKISDPIILFFF